MFECWKMFAVKEEEGSERGLFLEVGALQRFKGVQNLEGFQVLLQDLFVFHPLVCMAQRHTLHQFAKDDSERQEPRPRREVQKETEMWIFHPCLCSLSLGADAGQIPESSLLRLSRGCPIPSSLALPCGHLQTLCRCIFSLPGPASFLPSVPLFITPPCTVKPPVTLPLLLLLQIYCTCRVK